MAYYYLLVLQEVSAMAGCKCPNITEYIDSALPPGTSELLIVMELMACSVADLVSPSGAPVEAAD